MFFDHVPNVPLPLVERAMEADPCWLPPSCITLRAIVALDLDDLSLRQRIFVGEHEAWATAPRCHLCGLPVDEDGIIDVELHDKYWGNCCVCIACARKAWKDERLAAVYDFLYEALVSHPALIRDFFIRDDGACEYEIVFEHLCRTVWGYPPEHDERDNAKGHAKRAPDVSGREKP